MPYYFVAAAIALVVVIMVIAFTRIYNELTKERIRMLDGFSGNCTTCLYDIFKIASLKIWRF
ncbi:hypothetical protein BH10BAC3_BH10BAC3_40050 [soil metagenome]